MRLFENPEFEQAVLRAAEHFGVSEQFVDRTQCDLLFSKGDYPPFEDVLARFEELRPLL